MRSTLGVNPLHHFTISVFLGLGFFDLSHQCISTLELRMIFLGGMSINYVSRDARHHI